MPRYMVVVKDEGGNVNSAFFNDFRKADDYYSIASTSMGYYAEMYVRRTETDDDIEIDIGYVMEY